MDGLVTVCSWNSNGHRFWAWMLWSSYAVGTRTESWFGHGCSGHRMLLERIRNYGVGMDALVTVCSWNTYGIMVWAWMLWSSYGLGTRTELGLGMDALFTVCSWNSNGITTWAWMLWSPYALGTLRNHGLGMDALVTVCSCNTIASMVQVWKLS